VVDVCTGSGCLAILLAQHFPQAKVDAVDLSPDALDVAKINVAAHGLEKRVKLWASDVFDAVRVEGVKGKVKGSADGSGEATGATWKYDVILSNPPYEPSAHVDAQAPEFAAEPRMAHDGGGDGLEIIRKLLRQARTRLTDEGIVLIEVGGLVAAMDREFAALEPFWLHTADGADCVCVIHAARLAAWRG
jgi:ribosomal protein L3 glutamine methyltransferase